MTVLIATLLIPVANAAEQMPPLSRQDREIVMAAVNIGMTEEQRLQFRNVVGQFVDDYSSSMLKIMRGNNATDVERRMKNKGVRLLDGMDADMDEFLSKAQFTRYQLWRELMIAKLTHRAPTQPDELMTLKTGVVTNH